MRTAAGGGLLGEATEGMEVCAVWIPAGCERTCGVAPDETGAYDGGVAAGYEGGAYDEGGAGGRVAGGAGGTERACEGAAGGGGGTERARPRPRCVADGAPEPPRGGGGGTDLPGAGRATTGMPSKVDECLLLLPSAGISRVSSITALDSVGSTMGVTSVSSAFGTSTS